MERTALAVRHAYLSGMRKWGERQYRILDRALNNLVPPWIQRVIQHLLNTAHYSSKSQTLQVVLRLEEPQHELSRLGKTELLTWHLMQNFWGLAPEHAPYLANLIAGQMFTSGSPQGSKQAGSAPFVPSPRVIEDRTPGRPPQP